MEGLAFEAEHYNYLLRLEEEIGSQLNSHTSFDGSGVGSGYAELSLPDASEMAQYDTLHMELELEWRPVL